MKIAELQEQFLTALQNPSGSANSLFDPIQNLNRRECFDIYKKGYRARLIESLGATFEASWWVLGDESYFKVASDYVTANPSQAYDLSDYGDGFPEFLAHHPESSEIPFIKDLAEFEWNFKSVFHSPNLEKTFDFSQFDESSILKLKSGLELQHSQFNLYEIWKHRSESIEVLDSVDWETPSFLITYRSGGKVYVRNLDQDIWNFLNIFKTGSQLDSAIENLSEIIPDLTPARIQEIFAELTEYLEISSNS